MSSGCLCMQQTPSWRFPYVISGNGVKQLAVKSNTRTLYIAAVRCALVRVCTHFIILMWTFVITSCRLCRSCGGWKMDDCLSATAATGEVVRHGVEGDGGGFAVCNMHVTTIHLSAFMHFGVWVWCFLNSPDISLILDRVYVENMGITCGTASSLSLSFSHI